MGRHGLSTESRIFFNQQSSVWIFQASTTHIFEPPCWTCTVLKAFAASASKNFRKLRQLCNQVICILVEWWTDIMDNFEYGMAKRTNRRLQNCLWVPVTQWKWTNNKASNSKMFLCNTDHGNYWSVFTRGARAREVTCVRFWQHVCPIFELLVCIHSNPRWIIIRFVQYFFIEIMVTTPIEKTTCVDGFSSNPASHGENKRLSFLINLLDSLLLIGAQSIREEKICLNATNTVFEHSSFFIQ